MTKVKRLLEELELGLHELQQTIEMCANNACANITVDREAMPSFVAKRVCYEVS